MKQYPPCMKIQYYVVFETLDGLSLKEIAWGNLEIGKQICRTMKPSRGGANYSSYNRESLLIKSYPVRHYQIYDIKHEVSEDSVDVIFLAEEISSRGLK